MSTPHRHIEEARSSTWAYPASKVRTEQVMREERGDIPVVFFALVFGLFALITRGTRAILGPRRRLEEELGMEVLRRRLARGEITQTEFDQAKRALGG